MDSGQLTLLAALLLLMLTSAFFSATETAFMSFNRIRMKNLAAQDNAAAQLALRLNENYEKILTTVLIGNNIVNIVSASLATVLFTAIIDNNDLAVTLSTVVMTVVVLIFGEITPKTLAKESADSFILANVKVIRFLVVLFTPLNAVFGLWQRMVMRLFTKGDADKITEDELLTIVEEAREGGGINDAEGDLIRSAIEFNDLDVTDVWTPRVDVVAIDVQWNFEKIFQTFAESEYSRIPVYRGTIDSIIGVVNQRDFHMARSNGNFDIKSIIKPVKFIYSTMKISRLLKLLQQTKSHIVIVTDEYGGTEGIVTLEDILEALVGEIWDEYDEITSEIEKIDDNTYRVDANTPIDKFFEIFDMERDEDVTSVGGFVVSQCGEIPEEGDSFTYEDLEITVTKADKKRVSEVVAKKKIKEEKEEN